MALWPSSQMGLEREWVSVRVFVLTSVWTICHCGEVRGRMRHFHPADGRGWAWSFGVVLCHFNFGNEETGEGRAGTSARTGVIRLNPSKSRLIQVKRMLEGLIRLEQGDKGDGAALRAWGVWWRPSMSA